MEQAEIARIIRKATHRGYIARAKELGNTEQVVIIDNYHDHAVYLWSVEDWNRFILQRLLSSQRKGVV